jgi:SET domain-containing protein
MIQYTRLKCSDIHGVGVFAIRDIPKGVNPFRNDNSRMIWINKSEVLDVRPELKKLYHDFCVMKGELIGCPENFDSLTVSWYLNHSKTPNVKCTEDYTFVTLKEIKEGEELLVDYSEYSDEWDIGF